MIARRQLPVASPVSAVGLLRAAAAAMTRGGAHGGDYGGDHGAVRAALADRFSARAIALTDSGTSALVVALRAAAGERNTVALPAYACVDLIAAARLARVWVRLYDVVPDTLSPDFDSLARVLRAGVDSVVVAHLYGYPADAYVVRAAAAEHGVTVIEDAAQHAGATLRGHRAGSLGDLSVLSFGRGKGTTGGNGGAVLALSERWTTAVESADAALPPAPRGARDVAGAAVSWALGRPAVYGVPSSIPALHLGETVYHEAHEPLALSRAAAALLRTTLARADDATAIRRRHAAQLARAAAESRRARACTPIAGAEPGYLRFAVLGGPRTESAPALGVVRGYPRPLADQLELAPLLQRSPETLTGARELAARLLTLPTHHMVSARDLAALGAWLRAA